MRSLGGYRAARNMDGCILEGTMQKIFKKNHTKNLKFETENFTEQHPSEAVLFFEESVLSNDRVSNCEPRNR